MGPGISRYIRPTVQIAARKPRPTLRQLTAHGVMRSETATVFLATIRSNAESPALRAGQ